MKYCHFGTKYELICSFNTFCTCICPYYVQKTYKTTYEFHFQLAFSRRVRFLGCSRRAVRDVITEFPRIPPNGGAFIISFGRSPSRRPRFVHFHCLFRTEYELICSFNTFSTCICPYYVQKTYKTTYEFHFQLGFSRRVQAVTSHGVPSHPPAGGAFIISFGRSQSRRPRFVRDILSFLY